jgi:bifunctional DNA-binding transcriptional regulator/antitoxin component of YhaV-PrlF toxin-antitoxin module
MVICLTNKTKISNGFQTVVPSSIRKKFKVGPGDLIEWVASEEGVELKFRKKVSLDEITDIVDTKKTDAVELKKKAQRG